MQEHSLKEKKNTVKQEHPFYSQSNKIVEKQKVFVCVLGTIFVRIGAWGVVRKKMVFHPYDEIDWDSLKIICHLQIIDFQFTCTRQVRETVKVSRIGGGWREGQMHNKEELAAVRPGETCSCIRSHRGCRDQICRIKWWLLCGLLRTIVCWGSHWSYWWMVQILGQIHTNSTESQCWRITTASSAEPIRRSSSQLRTWLTCHLQGAWTQQK